AARRARPRTIARHGRNEWREFPAPHRQHPVLPEAGGGARQVLRAQMSVPVVNVGFSSTNYWVLGQNGARLLVDLGFPGTFGKMRANLDRMNVPLREIRYALATHYHIDHAGCAQDLKNAGVPLLVLESQAGAIPL